MDRRIMARRTTPDAPGEVARRLRHAAAVEQIRRERRELFPQPWTDETADAMLAWQEQRLAEPVDGAGGNTSAKQETRTESQARSGILVGRGKQAPLAPDRRRNRPDGPRHDQG